MSASAVASTSESADFKAKIVEYNGIHTKLKSGPLQQFVKSYTDLGQKINNTFKLPEETIENAVAKKKAFEELEPILPVITTEYNQIRDGITLNNADLKALKLRIEAAITAKKLAAAAAKAAQDASNAAQAQALAEAKTALQTQIDELNKLITDRTDAFEQERTLKTQHVLHNLQTVIPNTVDGIKNLLQGEHISQATRDMVEGIDTDINEFKSKVDFEKLIATPFKGRNDAEIAGIQAQIGAQTDAMNGSDINAMQSALASTPLRLSTTLGDFISAADAFFKGTLDAKLTELDGADAQVKAAIATDLKTFQEEDAKIKELQSKINAVVDSQEITAIIKSIDNKIIDVESSKYGIVNTLADNASPVTKQLKNTKYATSISGLNAELMKMDNAIHRLLSLPNESFDTIKKQLNDIQSARTSRGINAPSSSISILNQKIQGFQDKRKEVNDTHKEHENNHKRISEGLYESRSPSPGGTAAGPIVPAPPSGVRPSSAAPRNPTAAAAAAAGRASPQEGWVKVQPLKPIPSDNEQPDAADADIASEPVTPPAPIIGARRNFLYVSHNTEPKTAYLVVVKKPRVDESQGGGGGNKNYHIQKGGSPPPDDLQEGSEIFLIDVDNNGFVDVMAGLLPPKLLLTVSDDGTGENPIITKIRSGQRLKGDRNTLYDKIKRDLITDDNENPLTIGLRAVYYQNIIKLIRLLDNTLNPGRRVHQEMFEKLRKFMDFTDGTFGVLEALFDATFKRNPTSPRPNTTQEPPPKIDEVFEKLEIKKIVGWKSNSNTENTHFAMLFDKFSIICPHNGIKNTFLTDDVPVTQKNLGSKKTGYNQFRLNWIILLAFHTLYIGKSTTHDVGELIKALYDAFLGWMAMSTHKDTFERMFRNTLVRQTPAQAYSEQVAKRINDINGNDPTLQPLVKAIQTKLCELENVPKPAIDVPHNGEYDDLVNDPDYVPPQEGYDSDDGDTTPRRRAAATELRLLSPSGLKDGEQRRPLQFRRGPPTDEKRRSVPPVPPLGDPNPDRVVDSESESEYSDSDVEITQRPLPLQLQLPLGGIHVGQTGPLYERRRATQDNLKAMGVNMGNLYTRPSSSPSKPQSDSVTDRPRETLRPGAVSQFHTVANRDVKFGTRQLPQTVIEQQQRSQPAVLSQMSPRKPPSSDVFLRTQRPTAPASTPALIPAPPSTLNPGFGRTSTSSLRRLPSGYNIRGGNNKKRTRKHKKHTSISASRRPTRRRRIPPTEGQKYTRKRPRT